MQRCILFQQDIDTRPVLYKAFYRVSQSQFDAVLAYLVMDKGSHISIEGVHQLLWPLNNGHLDPQLPEVLCHFQTDKAAADHNGRLGLVRIHKFLDPEGIFYRTKGK